MRAKLEKLCCEMRLAKIDDYWKVVATFAHAFLQGKATIMESSCTAADESVRISLDCSSVSEISVDGAPDLLSRATARLSHWQTMQHGFALWSKSHDKFDPHELAQLFKLLNEIEIALPPASPIDSTDNIFRNNLIG
jgi:hypothetical protein